MHYLFASLVFIMAGTLLLAKTKKDGLGKFFKFISWFNIIVGFFMFIHVLCGHMNKMIHHCCKKDKACCDKEMKMNCDKKDMKMGNCFMAKHFGEMEDDDDDARGGCKVVYVIMCKGGECDSMMANCMPKPGCMDKPGCDTTKSCCKKKVVTIKK